MLGFKDNKIVGLFSCTSHLTDIGGLGVGPDATDIHMEGLYIPMLKLADKGVMNKTLLVNLPHHLSTFYILIIFYYHFP